jgi:CHAT domain-containing protein
MERRGFGEGAVRPGSRFRLRVEVREAGRLYALLRWGTAGTSMTAWLSPPEGTEEVLDPERVSPGTHHIPGFVPEEAVEASVLILTSREPIRRPETKDLERVAESAEPWRGLVELAGRIGGEPALVELFPPDPRAELERVLEGGETLALRSFVDFRPEGAAAVTASLLEEGLAEGGGNPEAFAKAERVARAWKEVRDSGILLDRVEWYRALARSPEALRTRRDLDRSIRRDLAVHDQNIGIARGTRSTAEAVTFFASRAREYRERGDVWGEIESGLRRAWNEPSGGRRSAAFREAAELSRAFAYPRGEGLALFGLGFDASSRNPTSLPEIRALYTASARILRTIRLEEALGVAANNLGHQCNKEGCVGEAFGHLEEAVRTLRKIGSKRDEAIARQNLGRAFEIVGQPKEAVGQFEDSELTLRGLRENSSDPERIVQIYEARAAARAARALVQVRSLDRALDTARRAIVLARALPEPEQEALSWARLALAEIEMRRGSFVEAERLAREASESAPGFAWRTGEALLGRGYALRSLGRYTDAAETFAVARERLEGLVGDGSLSADVLLAIAGLQEEQGRIEEACTTLQQWLRYARAMLDSQGLSAERRRTLRERLRPGFVAGVRLAVARARQGDPDAASLAFRFFETARPHSLARLAGRAVSEESPPGAVLADLERALGGGARFLEYLHGEKTSYVLVASARGQTVHDLGVPGAVLEERASDLRRAITDGFPMEEVERAGRAAWDVFLSPVAEEVESSNLLVVSHDPGARPFPFEALVPPREGEVMGGPPFLLRAAAIAYVPSAAVLVEIYDRAHAHDRPEPSRPFLALGDPASCLDLPDARAEVEGIARLFPAGAEVLIGALANEGFVKSGSLSEFRVVHFAAHAYLREEPALALARSLGEDGTLTASEAASLPALGAELLALSTCGPDGGISEGTPWEAGLPAAFLSNGAASVLSPLWPVTDAATARLMVRFYEGIARGIPRAEALREARLALLDGEVSRPSERAPGPSKPSDEWSHPRHWAAFVLEGSPR